MFGMGFTEILLIAVVAILFLGPDKLPTAMVEVAKFFRSVKKTVSNVQDSIEQEMKIADLKKEALAYKKELMNSTREVRNATDLTEVTTSLSAMKSEIMDVLDEDDRDDVYEDDEPKKQLVKKDTKEKTITKEENKDV